MTRVEHQPSLLFFRQDTSKEWEVIHQPTGVKVVTCPTARAAAQACAAFLTSIDWAFTMLPPSDSLSQQILSVVRHLEKQHLVCRGQSAATHRSITLARADRLLRQEFTPEQWRMWRVFSSHAFERERLLLSVHIRREPWLLQLQEDNWLVHPQMRLGVINSIPLTQLAAFFAGRADDGLPLEERIFL